MTIMKALKTFRVGETKQDVSAGKEFTVSANTARDYEARGMAVEVKIARGQSGSAPPEKIEIKASTAGPLASPGGAIGGMTSQSLSHQGQAPRKPHSKKSGGALDL